MVILGYWLKLERLEKNLATLGNEEDIDLLEQAMDMYRQSLSVQKVLIAMQRIMLDVNNNNGANLKALSQDIHLTLG